MICLEAKEFQHKPFILCLRNRDSLYTVPPRASSSSSRPSASQASAPGSWWSSRACICSCHCNRIFTAPGLKSSPFFAVTPIGYRSAILGNKKHAVSHDSCVLRHLLRIQGSQPEHCSFKTRAPTALYRVPRRLELRPGVSACRNLKTCCSCSVFFTATAFAPRFAFPVSLFASCRAFSVS